MTTQNANSGDGSPLPSTPGSTGYAVNGQYGHTEYKTMLEAMKDNRIFTVDRTDAVFVIREHCDEWFWADLTPDQLRALGQELIDLSNTEV